MNNRCYIAGIVALFLSAFLLSGCTSTRVTGVWKKSDFAGGPFQSIMVVGMTRDESNRSIWEDIMADQLKQHGVNATTSAKCFPGDTDITKNEILEYVEKQGIGAVLVTRLVDIKEHEVYYPPTGSYYGDYYGYYGGGYYGRYYHRYYDHFGTFYDRFYSPGYTTTYTSVILETNLYDTGTQELVWSMSSDTFDPASANKLAQSVSKQVIKALQKNNLIKPAK